MSRTQRSMLRRHEREYRRSELRVLTTFRQLTHASLTKAEGDKVKHKETMTGIIVAIGTMMANYVVCFPIVVSRHTSQALSTASSWQYDTPVYCFRVLHNKYQQHGMRSLYSGFGLGLLGQALTSTYETGLSRLFARVWGKPRAAHPRSAQWLYQGLRLLIHIPLYPLFRTALILRVQSADDALISSAGDFLRHYRDDLARFWNVGGTGLTLWSTFVPFCLFNVVTEKAMLVIYKRIYRAWTRKVKKDENSDDKEDDIDEKADQEYHHHDEGADASLRHMYYPEIACGMLSSIVTRTLCYPSDTIIFKLMIQGTGFTTQTYAGVMDCATQMYRAGGVLAFFPGWGAVVLELAAGYLILEASWWVYTYMDHRAKARIRQKQ
ncbi:mitochondrial carrier domain-containing protein [Gongronella butleri]|nr:mitochondrial carrier domain-containing protein [Gongronella butleri]